MNRRLLMQGGGSSIIAPLITITSQPEGAWTSPQYPKAVSHNGYTYIGWINGSTGALKVAAVNESTGAVSTPVQIDSMGGNPDTHNSPALLVRDSDHKLIVAFCLHLGANLFYRVSTTSLDADPTLADGFAAAVNIDSSMGGEEYTYPALVQLTGVANDPIYLFIRDRTVSTNNTRLMYSVSTDGGVTWGTGVSLFDPTGALRPYWSIGSDGSSRIDVVTSDRNPYGEDGGTLSIGHLYFDGSTWRNSAGTAIAGGTPFDLADITTVYTGTDAFPMDVLSSANPVFGYLISDGSTTTARYARWDGSAWDLSTVYTGTAHPVDRFYGSVAFNRADPNELFSGRYVSSTVSEMWRFTTSDSGATWTGSAVTTGSSVLNASPTGIFSGSASLPVVWLRGTLTSSTVFNFGIRGLRR